MKIFYFALCVLGTLLPLNQFIPWFTKHGLNMSLMMQEIAAAPLSAFAWLDVLVSALALIIFVLYEGKRLRMRKAWMALLGLCVGVSLALPLFLLMREYHLRDQDNKH